MTKRTTAMIPLILAAALGSSLPAVAQSVAAPIAHLGDVRDYQTIDDWTNQVRREEHQEVVGVVPEFVRVRTEQKNFNLRTNRLEPGSTEEVTLRADLNTDFATRSGTARRLNFDWPLQPGKKWRYEYSYPIVGDNGAPLTLRTRMEAQVEGWETVTTPAGTFRALKVVHAGTMEASTAPGIVSRVGWTLWYSGEAGTYVKSTYQSDSAAGAPGARSTTVLTALKRTGS